MKKRFIFLFVLVYFSCSLFGQYPKPTSAERFLHNFSKVQVLSAADQAQIEQRLDAFEQETSNEITVVIIDDLNGDEPWHYATELGEEWGVGKADKNNGLVFLIKPTQENGGRQVYLAPGRGLEAVITDLSCHDIVQHEILPEFKKNQYAQGINKALDILFKLAKGEINEKSYRDGIRKDKWVGGIFALLFILGALFLLIKRGGGDNGTTFGGRRAGPGFFYFGGGGFGGGFGGGSSGGGGFGGFGGGSFGGGGSGGSW